jgi:hypothetical protein
MNIEIHDPALEARIRRQIHATGAASAEEALLRLLETQEERKRQRKPSVQAMKLMMK